MHECSLIILIEVAGGFVVAAAEKLNSCHWTSNYCLCRYLSCQFFTFISDSFCGWCSVVFSGSHRNLDGRVAITREGWMTFNRISVYQLVPLCLGGGHWEESVCLCAVFSTHVHSPGLCRSASSKICYISVLPHTDMHQQCVYITRIDSYESVSCTRTVPYLQY